ncbi:NAD(P)/FAD-dependent oxidoreductase [Mucilaginibacter sp. PAMB04168]|uniref:flavin monoamine oxidase family protein n=1 Tax=Mucilaginibacter sp. PAMB04168 TaxID=3138567 RepID=UPI0031F65C15
MSNADVLIIGAGAAGLMAAHTLAKAGKKIIVLEALNRTGGRIHTVDDTVFFKHAELGAEFVHGDLPVTLSLLNEAGITYRPAGGEMWQYRDGTFTKNAGMVEGWDLLMEKLNALQEDMNLDEFLKQYFADVKFEALKESVRKFAAGYDTSDPSRVSTLALRNEWNNEDEGAQHRIDGGYCHLIQYLVSSIKQAGGTLLLNAPVARVQWQFGQATAVTADNESFNAPKIIFALPLGVWQAPADAKGAITFEPAVPDQMQALRRLGFGAIIKILLQFDEAFWEDAATEELAGKSLANMGFLFSDEAVPTWWTQAPEHSTLLTGWLGGPAAAEWKDKSDEEILIESLQSLAHIFNRSPEALREKLQACHVANWTAEPYIYGSYAYDTVDTINALQVLNKHVDNTLYFAGEFMYQGPAMGTVEAALTSGKYTAEKVLKYG